MVSVVIPCYNVEDYVLYALDSVAAQTHPNLEIICVDDGSSDGTFVVIEQWKQTHRDFKVILVKQKNSGACAARNNGLNHASGSMIQFLDADDILYPEKIAHQVRLMSESDTIRIFFLWSY